MNVLKAVKHDYIVEFLYVEKNHNTLLLFLEYMEGVNITTVVGFSRCSVLQCIKMVLYLSLLSHG